MNGATAALAERLGRIGAEIREVAAALEDPSPPKAGGEGGREDPMARARRLLGERRALQAVLPQAAAAEPAWAMLLVLFTEAAGGRPLSAKALAIAADAPASTAQRWLDLLAGAGLVTRATDAADRRRVELSLTDEGRALVTRCLAALAPGPR